MRIPAAVVFNRLVTNLQLESVVLRRLGELPSPQFLTNASDDYRKRKQDQQRLTPILAHCGLRLQQFIRNFALCATGSGQADGVDEQRHVVNAEGQQICPQQNETSDVPTLEA